jgi:hypothetical protein
MRNFFVLIIATNIFAESVCSQYVSIGLKYGMETCSMKSLKDLQEHRRLQSNLPLKTTECYPVTPFYQVEIANVSDGFIYKAGIFYTFNSTGARSTLSDYSGRCDLDAVVNGHQIGISLEHLLEKKGRVKYGIYSDVGYLRTKLKTRDYVSLVFPEPYMEEEKFLFLANGLSVEPGFFVMYPLKGIQLGMNLGFLFSYSQEFFLEENKDVNLVINDRKVKPGWSGLRIGLQVDITNHRF